MQEKKVFIYNANGEKLVGIETLPDKVEEKLPAIVLVHGFCVTKSESGMFDALAQKLVEAGFASYRFDFSGRGESEGNYEKTTLTKMKDEMAKILEFVKSRPNIDENRIGILGQSLGTPVTVALEPKVKAIILMGAVARPKEILRVSSPWKKLDEKGVSIKIRPNEEVITIGPQFWSDFDNYNLLKCIGKIHCPILFIHGSKDNRVPASEMEAYFENANQPKEKMIIQGAEHSMEPKRKDMYEIVVTWFEKNLA